MPHINITDINYIIKGETENLINLNINKNGEEVKNITFLTDTGNEVANISSTTMTHRIIKTTTNVNTYITTVGPSDIIYALFDFKDVALKSQVLKREIDSYGLRSGELELDTENFVDIYAPHLSSNPIEFCQGIYIGESGYTNLVSFGLSKSTTNSPLIKGTNLTDTRKDRMNNKNNSLYWQYKIIESGNKTYLGIPLSALEKNHVVGDELSTYYPVNSYFDYLSSYGGLSVNMLSNLFIPANNLKDIERNYIYQLNLLDNRQLYNNHNTGDIMCEFVIGKNPYNATYSMNMSSLDKISNVRNYTGIGAVGGRVFFKYNDNLEYTRDKDDPERNLLNKSQINDKKYNNYQKIEYLHSVSQFKSSSYHKSNLYSIKIRGLFDNIPNDSFISKNLTKIKHDITRSIRKIAESLSPAHTQLFDVIYSSGKTGIVDENSSGLINNVVFIFEEFSNDSVIIGLTEFGKHAENLIIPANVLSIYNGALNQSKNAYTLNSSSEMFTLLDDTALIQGKTLISYPTDNESCKFFVPEFIEEIYSSAFYNCQHLLKVEIPLSVKVDGLPYNQHTNKLHVTNNFPIIRPYYSYLVNFDSGDANDTINKMNPQHFYSNIDQQLSENKFKRTGYLFDKWEKDNKKFNDKQWNFIDQFSDNYSPVTLTAKWVPITYYIRFNPRINKSDYEIASGTMDDMILKYDDPEKKLHKCEYKKLGYHFYKWHVYGENSFNELSSFIDEEIVKNLTNINNDIITLYPSFEENEYKIKCINGDPENVNAPSLPITKTYKYNSNWNLQSIYRNKIYGYNHYDTTNIAYIVSSFIGYTSKNKLINEEMPFRQNDRHEYINYINLETENNAVIDLSARWAGVYHIAFNPCTSNITKWMDNQIAIINDKKLTTLNKNTYNRVGYEFDKWEYNNKRFGDEYTFGNLTTTIKPGEIIELSAVWIRLYKIVFDSNTATSGSMDPIYIKRGFIKSIPSCNFEKPGYEFKGWSYKETDNKDSKVESTEVNFYNEANFELTDTVFEYLTNNGISIIDYTITLYAVWEPNTYYIKFNKNF